MTTLTIFTPTFNRAYCLPRLYESLVRQTSGDFAWLIIDDGSADGTRELVHGWIAEGRIPIRYHWQENQGMHGAHNTAYALIVTELNVCIDSDDWLPAAAVETIVSFWRRHGGNAFAGMVGLDAFGDGAIVGTRMPPSVQASTLFDLYHRHGVRGDKKLVYRTELTRRHPYPRFEGEKYVGLACKYYKIDIELPLLLLDDVLCHVEYMPDGSSRNMLQQYRRNPRGFAFYRRELMRLPFGGMLFKYRQAVHYVSSSLMCRNRRMLAESPKRLLTLLAIPPGVCLFLFIAWNSGRRIAGANAGVGAAGAHEGTP